jgi:hypothetical protein
MKADGFESNQDFFDFVTMAASHLNELGFFEANEELTRLMNSAWTTSSELFGEIGLACENILKRDGKRLPSCLATDLKRCKAVCKSAFG